MHLIDIGVATSLGSLSATAARGKTETLSEILEKPERLSGCKNEQHTFKIRKTPKGLTKATR
jgi:hypothetical protein